ncbi:hypothetical protein [Kitasatospora sp. NPDC002965]|uniref:hypothetical protein n=1 Tax=Kitasatospora sp. NPDC002965 TaxID=3154775 RepID=UPI0033BB996F
MDCEEVMLTVRITAAERALLRALARGHGTDVSDVVVDGLLDVIPSLHARSVPRSLPGLPVAPVRPGLPVPPVSPGLPGANARAGATASRSSTALPVLPGLPGEAAVPGLLRLLSRPAPCAVTLWLPGPVADLLPLVGERVTLVSGLRVGPASGALGAALRLWLAGDPVRLAASLATLHRQGVPGYAAQRLGVAA